MLKRFYVIHGSSEMASLYVPRPASLSGDSRFRGAQPFTTRSSPEAVASLQETDEAHSLPGVCGVPGVSGPSVCLTVNTVLLSKLPPSTAGGEDDVTGCVLPPNTSRHGNVGPQPAAGRPTAQSGQPRESRGPRQAPRVGEMTARTDKHPLQRATRWRRRRHAPAGARGASAWNPARRVCLNPQQQNDFGRPPLFHWSHRELHPCC